jgi:hypothetical protein
MWFCTVLLLLTLGPVQADEPIIIDVDATEIDAPKTYSFIGLRPASDWIVSGVNSDQSPSFTYYVPEEIIAKSLSIDEKMRMALDAHGIDEAYSSFQALAQFRVSLDDVGFTSPDGGIESVELTSADIDSSGGYNTPFDARLINNMVASGVFDMSRRATATVGGQVVNVIPIKEELGGRLWDVYLGAKSRGTLPVSSPSVAWDNDSPVIGYDTASYYSLDKAISVRFGRATFGRPRIWSAQELNLDVEPAISRVHDVYMLEFAMTFHDLPVNDVQEIAFKIEVPDDVVAWELVPLRVVSADHISDVIGTPELSIKGVSVGRFFSREIRYKALRPMITAFGLRENEFSWSLKHDAIAPGSHVFMAALGIPKEVTSLRIKQSAAVKTKPLLLEGSWASTPPDEREVQLH